MAEREEIVAYLESHIGSLPHEQYGVINLLPFAVKSDQTDALRRQVCEAIADLLINAGMVRLGDATVQVETRDVTVACRLCSKQLFMLHTDDNGFANIPAMTFITNLARMAPECPHDVVTPDDQRRKIEELVRASQ